MPRILIFEGHCATAHGRLLGQQKCRILQSESGGCPWGIKMNFISGVSNSLLETCCFFRTKLYERKGKKKYIYIHMFF